MRRPVVLVVSRDPDTRCICAACLRHVGYDVRLLAEPEAALAVARALRPDVIVATTAPFGTAGPDVPALVRADEGLAGTPVLALATWPRADSAGTITLGGATAVLPVPLRLTALIETVDRLVA